MQYWGSLFAPEPPKHTEGREGGVGETASSPLFLCASVANPEAPML